MDKTTDREALKAELLAEIKAELAAGIPAKKETSPPDPWLEDYVSVQLFKDGGRYKDDVYVAVNGENCVVKRGVPVMIKRKFALVLDGSQEQDVKAAEYAAQMSREFDKEAKLYSL